MYNAQNLKCDHNKISWISELINKKGFNKQVKQENVISLVTRQKYLQLSLDLALSNLHLYRSIQKIVLTNYYNVC